MKHEKRKTSNDSTGKYSKIRFSTAPCNVTLENIKSGKDGYMEYLFRTRGGGGVSPPTYSLPSISCCALQWVSALLCLSAFSIAALRAASF